VRMAVRLWRDCSLTCAARSTLKDVAVESLRAGRQTTSTMRPPDLTTCDCAACGQDAGGGCRRGRL